MNNIYYLSTDGAGTPKYMIVASNINRAFEMAQMEWSKTYSGHIGSHYNWHTGKNTNGNDVRDIKYTGIRTNDPEHIVDLCEL